ncbi:recombinase family protein [Saccharopolyspora pogona]|uniref:recombinase family protein n=1 Tax=Saccharopolyspora pogona TaxID=333966 RepID=UPI001685A106|nr:recombinase family protein [Saccharopolyspora pogona]
MAYYRVSSADQKDDLTRQVGCVVEEYGTRGISLDATVTEVGSGPNGTRTKLRKILAYPGITRIVVEHRDRLARFGVEHLEAALSATGRELGP